MLALFISVLALLAMHDLQIVWRCLRVIAIVLALLLALLIVGVLLEATVAAFFDIYNMSEGMLFHFIFGLLVLVVAGTAYDLVRRRRRRAGRNGQQGHDPGEYKTGGG